MLQKQRNGHGIGVLVQLLADEVDAAEHVGPLIVAAELHLAAVILVQSVEVVALHQHIGKFKEGKSGLHAVDIAARAEHFVYIELRSDVTHEIQEVQITEPVRIVDDLCLSFAKFDEAGHLLLEAFYIVINHINGHHLPHVGAAGGVADHRGASADKGDRLVARRLKSLHQQQGHKVAHMQGISGRIKADIEGGFSLIDEIGDFLFVCELREQSARLKFFVKCHCSAILLFCLIPLAGPSVGK